VHAGIVGSFRSGSEENLCDNRTIRLSDRRPCAIIFPLHVKTSFHHFRFIVAIATTLIAMPALAYHDDLGDLERPFGELLDITKEPNLGGRHMDKITETYRFFWIRTFHKPIIIRMWKNREGTTLRVIRLSGQGGYKFGHIERDQSYSVNAAQWDEFQRLLREAEFWEMPSDNSNDPGFSDGSDWAIEGKLADKYHVVGRRCPLDDSEKRHLDGFIACCRYLLKLSGEVVPAKEDY
jgi:hypothetical protein